MIKNIIASFLLVFFFTNGFSQNASKDIFETKNGTITIQPVLHSSLIITYNNTTIYVDPYGGIEKYKDYKNPDIVLITDIHGDHLDLKTLDSINTSTSEIITASSVLKLLPSTYKSKTTVLKNGQGIHRSDIFIKAIAMYNLPEEKDSKHPKGRGNGYILTIDDTQIYISGDTEDTAEMRSLQNIDIAFVCMNLPYTMDINQAADAVLAFKPKVVYPFHYRGQNGFSDVEEFKNLVNSKNNQIDVRLKNWYPN
ncbi:MAG: MBL fold metallo-hydrolase [Lutibacter sp.]|nr:MBL fold metallo-hydrolase [Lutibacter sp.]